MSEFLRLAGVLRESVVDGPGLRYVVFAQGCPHFCDGCHNPNTHNPEGGYKASIEAVAKDILNHKYLKGITLSGGEPFLQASAFCHLLDIIKNDNFDIIAYSGFLFEELMQNEDTKKLLEKIDFLVDGKFENSKKSLLLKFRGSSNQRVIDVKKTLKTNKVVEIDW